MRCESWMNHDERPLGTRISDLKSLATNLRNTADRKEREAQQIRRDADEYDRQAENLRRR